MIKVSMIRFLLLGLLLLRPVAGLAVPPEASNGNRVRALLGARENKKSAPQSHSIRFELYRNLIFLRVRINGSRPLSLVLDTGASTSGLNKSVAEEIGLGLTGGRTNILGASEQPEAAEIAAQVKVQVAGIQLVAKEFIVVPMAEMESHVGHRIDGVLGADLFKAYVVEIDYPSQHLTLREPEHYQYFGRGEVLPLSLSDVPFVDATVGIGTAVTPGQFVIDTGWLGPLVFSASFVRQNRLLGMADLLPRIAFGVGGESRQMIGRIQTLQIGQATLEHPVAEFSLANSGPLSDGVRAGIIGNEILERFHLILDYRRSQAIFEPNAAFGQSFETDMSGLLLASEGKSLKEIRIERVFDDSPAARIDLRAGDLILSIDNKTVEQLPLARIMEMFRVDGRTYRLRIQRDQQVLQTSITTMRMI